MGRLDDFRRSHRLALGVGLSSDEPAFAMNILRARFGVPGGESERARRFPLSYEARRFSDVLNAAGGGAAPTTHIGQERCWDSTVSYVGTRFATYNATLRRPISCPDPN